VINHEPVIAGAAYKGSDAMRSVSLVLLAAIPLIASGCNKPSGDGGPPRETRTTAGDAAAETAAPEAAASRKGEAAKPASMPSLAYAYSYMLELPGREVRALMDRHEQACIEAGPNACQVMAANAQEDDGMVTGSLKMRAQPAWLNRFRAGIGRDAEAVGGRLETSGTGTDDLSRDIVDSEAAIGAKTVLRDRLKGLLGRHDGKLNDLVQAERRLAQVQGEIDTARAELSMMRARVQTASLTIDYRSFEPLVTGRATEPLKQAAHSVTGIVATGFAFILIVGACVLPFAIVALPGLLLWRARRRTAVKPTPT
jgi:uncharacterized protein DUF4349